VRNTTEEQARGSARIRDSVEQVRQTVEGINRALQDQSTSCRSVGESTEQLLARTRNNEEAARQMDEAVKALVTQAEALREDVRRFRIRDERAEGEVDDRGVSAL
jgi:methyl-accepting chemotaxis protein